MKTTSLILTGLLLLAFALLGAPLFAVIAAGAVLAFGRADIDQIAVAKGYEVALGAALGDDLDAPIDQTGSWSVTYSGFMSSAEKVRIRVRRVTESAAYLY